MQPSVQLTGRQIFSLAVTMVGFMNTPTSGPATHSCPSIASQECPSTASQGCPAGAAPACCPGDEPPRHSRPICITKTSACEVQRRRWASSCVRQTWHGSTSRKTGRGPRWHSASPSAAVPAPQLRCPLCGARCQGKQKVPPCAAAPPPPTLQGHRKRRVLVGALRDFSGVKQTPIYEDGDGKGNMQLHVGCYLQLQLRRGSLVE